MSQILHRMVQVEQHWIDQCATWLADRCSPILIKESRQAMKSWQFQWTFLLLLLAVVGWSFLAVSISLTTGFEEAGGVLMAGYLCILGFPLGVVLPLSAYRSLAREFDDETIQLISITTMSARRIVLGKLGSALLQLIVYLAAVVPCVAFSYILRGTDLTQILHMLLLCVVGSLSLTCGGLMLAGFAKFNWMAILLNLVLIVSTLLVYIFWCSFTVMVGNLGIPEEGFSAIWIFCGIMASTGYLAFECAVSLISFPSENRSTTIRFAISVQILALLLFATGTFAASEYAPGMERFYPVVSTVGSHYLAILGLMLVSEQGGLSQRVRRTLPTTILGRSLVGLYLPGPGRGYLFFLTALLFWNLVLGFTITSGWHTLFKLEADMSRLDKMWLALWINVIFATIYVSVVYLFMLCFGSWIKYGRIVAGLLLGFVGYFVTSIVCTSVDAFINMGAYRYGYSSDLGLPHHFNWPLISAYASEDFGPIQWEIVVLLGFGAGLLTLFCAAIAIKEFVVSPVAVPQRVQDETLKRKHGHGSANPFSEPAESPSEAQAPEHP